VKGFSIYFCFGKYAGFKKEISGGIFRVVLGWFSFAVMLLDIEIIFKNTIKNYRVLQDQARKDARAKVK